MKKNPWVGTRILEIFYWGTLGIVLFVFAFRFFHNVLSAVLLAAAVVLFKTVYSALVQRKPFDSTLYRLPLLESKGVVVEKRIPAFPLTVFLRESITFRATSGQLMKLYIVAAEFGDARRPRYLKVGDKGTFYYRSGKKHKYFQYFEKPRLELEDLGD